MGSTDEPVPHKIRRRWVGGFVLLAVGASAWALRASSPSKNTPAQTAASVKAVVDKAIAASEKKALARPALSALAYQRVVPSIVFIRTDEKAEKAEEPNDGSDPNAQDPFAPDASAADPSAADPFAPDTSPQGSNPSAPSDTTIAGSSAEPGARKPADEENGGLGTGVIINAEGAILTANHVVDGAKSIKVTFIDGSTSNATVISSEPDRDIAVLKADRNPEVVVPAVMGGGVRVGDEAFAIGHPLGLVDSMSSGVISGLNRSIPVGDDRTLDGLIQFDTAVNPGNSGGPLLNRAGQVVGIVTALANPSEQGVFIGIGFAVPIGAAAGAAGAGPGGPPR